MFLLRLRWLTLLSLLTSHFEPNAMCLELMQDTTRVSLFVKNQWFCFYEFLSLYSKAEVVQFNCNISEIKKTPEVLSKTEIARGGWCWSWYKNVRGQEMKETNGQSFLRRPGPTKACRASDDDDNMLSRLPSIQNRNVIFLCRKRTLVSRITGVISFIRNLDI